MKTDTNTSLLFFNALENTQKQYKKQVSDMLIKDGLDITYDQWRVLDIILTHKDINQSDIAAKTSKDTASVTRIIDLLNKKGYVARQTDPNNRRKLILGVSNHGEKEYQRAALIINECAAAALGGLKEKRIKKIRKMFRGIAKNCRKTA